MRIVAKKKERKLVKKEIVKKSRKRVESSGSAGQVVKNKNHAPAVVCEHPVVLQHEGDEVAHAYQLGLGVGVWLGESVDARKSEEGEEARRRR